MIATFEGRAFFDYHPSAVPRPYIGAVYTSAGVLVTRDLATAPVGSDDHPHHKGIWWGHRDVSGSDVWTEFDGHGLIRSDAEPILTTTATSVRIFHSMTWLSADNEALIVDRRTVCGFPADQHGVRILDMDLELSAAAGAVTLHDTKEAGLVALRLAPELEERRGGRITLSTGAVGEAESWGRPAQWCHYTGMVGDAEVGVAILDHPDNPLPAYWHVRDYGLLAVNPFGLRDFGVADSSGEVTLGADGLHAKYRILIHDGAIDVAAHHDAWIQR